MAVDAVSVVSGHRHTPETVPDSAPAGLVAGVAGVAGEKSSLPPDSGQRVQLFLSLRCALLVAQIVTRQQTVTPL